MLPSPNTSVAHSDSAVRTRQIGPRGLIPLTKWNDHFDWPPPGGLRHLRFYQDTNGFKEAFVECGNRILIDPDEFWKAVRQGAAHDRASKRTRRR